VKAVGLKAVAAGRWSGGGFFLDCSMVTLWLLPLCAPLLCALDQCALADSLMMTSPEPWEPWGFKRTSALSALLSAAPVPLFGDRATFPAVPVPLFRDRATFSAVPVPMFGDRTTFLAVPVPLFGDRATFSAVPVPLFGDRATFSAVPVPLFGDRTALSVVPDSTTVGEGVRIALGLDPPLPDGGGGMGTRAAGWVVIAASTVG
jgi:hypothetical protein